MTDNGVDACEEQLPPPRVASLGLAINGGGFRSSTVACGFMRGLHQLGILADAWYEAVPEAAGVRDNGDNFPLCTTFALYHPETVNMMADLAAWCVLSSSEKFLSFARG